MRALWVRTGEGSGVPDSVDTYAGAGSTYADAAPLGDAVNYVATVGVGTGVSLFDMQPGQTQEVINAGANALNVYPFVGGVIDALGTNGAYSLASGKTQIFRCIASGVFISLQLG